MAATVGVFPAVRGKFGQTAVPFLRPGMAGGTQAHGQKITDRGYPVCVAIRVS